MLNHRQNFSEIIAGYSKSFWRSQSIYFKHYTNVELGLASIEEDRIFQGAHNKGLPTEKEKIEFLKVDGLWTDAQERELKQQKEFLDNRIITKKSLIISAQIQQVNKEIEETQKKIYEILSARSALISLTVEQYVSRKMNENHIKFSTYKDDTLNNRLFSNDEFNELEDIDIEELIILYNARLDNLNQNIKKLAVSNFMQNLFCLCQENIMNFYGKPIVELTLFAIDLFIYARYFAPILQSENKPSEEMLENPDQIIENYTKNMNLKGAIGEKTADLTGGSVIGATKQDYKDAKIEGRFIDFRSKLKEGSGEISGADLANIYNS